MLDRTVEDLILASMATGEFKNLKGSGKPLKASHLRIYEFHEPIIQYYSLKSI